MKRENSHCDGLSLLELLLKASVNTVRVVHKTAKKEKARKKLLLVQSSKARKKNLAHVMPPLQMFLLLMLSVGSVVRTKEREMRRRGKM